MVQFIRDSSFM